MIVHDIDTEKSVASLEASQIESLRTAQAPEKLSLMEDAKVVVTFTGPISCTDLEQVLKEANATLDYCVIRYEDSDGQRITGWTSDISEEHLADKLNHLNKLHKDVTYSGVVSASISVDLTEENYAALINSDCVYFTDLSDTIIRLEHQDFNKELNVQICDLSWDLEFME